MAGMPAASARARSVRRDDGSTLVASTTAIRPFASRRSRVSWSTTNAAFVAAWFASSPETILRNASDDRTSSGDEMACRERRLARAGRADEDDQARVGQDDLGHGSMMDHAGLWAGQEAVRRTSYPPPSAARIS